MVIDALEVRSELDERVRRAEGLAEELADSGASLDASGEDPGEAMQRIWEEGLYDLSIPQAYGGLSPNGGWTFGLEALGNIHTAVSSIDGSVGQDFYTQHLVLRRIFDPAAHVPDSTLKQIVAEFKDKSLRFVSSNAESGSPEPVTAVATADGGILVRGVKTFNTNSVPPGYANVGLLLKGAEHQFGDSNHHAVIPLDHPNLVMHHDWDNMGQRGTQSQTITYDNVEVPAGWHYPRHPGAVGLRPMIHIFHGGLMLGCGFGALGACLRYIRASNRPLMSQFGTAATDPLIHRHLGQLSTNLCAAQALMRQTMRNIEELGEGDAENDDVFAQAMRTKVACLQSAMEAATTIFDLMGGRSTASKYAFDRYWRNIRTFAVHDPTDEKLVGIGNWQLNGDLPASVLKIVV